MAGKFVHLCLALLQTTSHLADWLKKKLNTAVNFSACQPTRKFTEHQPPFKPPQFKLICLKNSENESQDVPATATNGQQNLLPCLWCRSRILTQTVDNAHYFKVLLLYLVGVSAWLRSFWNHFLFRKTIACWTLLVLLVSSHLLLNTFRLMLKPAS